MARANPLNVGRILKTLFSWSPKQAHMVTYPGNIPLRGTVESLEEGMSKYSFNTSIPKRPGEIAPYHINCTDLGAFIDDIYPGYVRGDKGQHIQVELHPDESSGTRPKIFHTYDEFMEYNKAEELGRIIDEPSVDIKYSGANTDVPKRISLTRHPPSRSKTDYTMAVETLEAYNFVMIDVCINRLFNQRTTPSGSKQYKK